MESLEYERWSRYSCGTFIIYASSSGDPWNPFALIWGFIPVTTGIPIEEDRVPAAYIEISVERAKVFQGHPVDIRYLYEMKRLVNTCLLYHLT